MHLENALLLRSFVVSTPATPGYSVIVLFLTLMNRLVTVAGACFLAISSFSAGAIAETRMRASWYGRVDGFHGRTTANGEVFNADAYTAASKELPFGTRLRVCLDRCTTVRVNDRGPYIPGRQLDLSRAAADAIGLTDRGVANVWVEFL